MGAARSPDHRGPAAQGRQDAGHAGHPRQGMEVRGQGFRSECAFVNSLIVSGLPTKEFSFFGFLPLNKKNRKEALEKIAKENKTVILYEAPHKLQKTLQDLYEKLGDIPVCLVRELTKVHEEKIYGTLTTIQEKWSEPKGEFVIILDLNNKQEEKIPNDYSNMSLEEHYHFYEKMGWEKKDIIKQIAKDRNVAKNEIYQKFLKEKK